VCIIVLVAGAGIFIYRNKKKESQSDASNVAARPFVEQAGNGPMGKTRSNPDRRTSQREIDIGPLPPAYHDQWAQPSGSAGSRPSNMMSTGQAVLSQLRNKRR
jgi:hypothetical protein